MAEDANQLHIGLMKKSPRVNFKMLRIAEDDWQIVAECPGMEAHYIKVDEWLTGRRTRVELVVQSTSLMERASRPF